MSSLRFQLKSSKLEVLTQNFWTSQSELQILKSDLCHQTSKTKRYGETSDYEKRSPYLFKVTHCVLHMLCFLQRTPLTNLLQCTLNQLESTANSKFAWWHCNRFDFWDSQKRQPLSQRHYARHALMSNITCQKERSFEFDFSWFCYRISVALDAFLVCLA